MPSISGTVLDSAGAPAKRLVRVLRRDTLAILGQVYSSASTGAYSVSTGYSGECVVIAHDTDGDPLWNSVVFFVPLTGTNGSTTFTDAKGHTLSTVAGPVVSTGQYPPISGVNSSTSFDGSAGRIYCQTTDLAVGAGDFAIETYARGGTPSGDNYRHIATIQHPSGDLIIRYGNSGFGYKLQVSLLNTNVSNVWSCASTQTTHANAWKLIELSRRSGVCQLKIDGAIQSLNSGANPSTYPVTEFYDTTAITGTPTLNIGNHQNGTTTYLGNLAYFRFTSQSRGVSNYTPSGESFVTYFGGSNNAIIYDMVVPV